MVKFILLADDDQDDAELFGEALAEVFPTVICHWSRDGNELLTKLESDEFEKPDIIFLDVNMPGMDGWQCLTNVKKSPVYEHIPVVMYSTSSHKKDAEESSNLGALCFFTKPSDFKQLKTILKLIVAHLNGESPDPNAALDDIVFNKSLPTHPI